MTEELFKGTFILNEDFELLKNDEEYIFINYNEGLWFKTDVTGYELASLCDGRKSLEMIFDELSIKLGIKADLLKSMCTSFLDEMIVQRVIYDISVDKEKIYPRYSLEELKEDNMYPSSIWVHVTSMCNLSCPFCYSSSGDPSSFHILDKNKIIKLLSTVPEKKRESIVISGGEPLLYKGLNNLLREIKEDLKYKSITIITNGTVGEEKYEELSKYVDIMQFSVDSSIEEIYEITRGKGNYNKLINNIDYAYEIGFDNIVISFTPTIDNIETLPLLADFAYNHNVNAIHVSRLMPVGRGLENMNKLSIKKDFLNSKINECIQNCIEINKQIQQGNNMKAIKGQEERPLLVLSYGSDITQNIMSYGRRYTCGLGTSLVSINYDGKVYPCPSLHYDELVVGTLEDEIKTIVEKGFQFAKMASVDNDESECYVCKHKYFCGGSCKAVVYAYKNDLAASYNCEYERERIDKTIIAIK